MAQKLFITLILQNETFGQFLSKKQETKGILKVQYLELT